MMSPCIQSPAEWQRSPGHVLKGQFNVRRTSFHPAPAGVLCVYVRVGNRGHPDKIADQISDAVLDAILAKEIELQEQGYIAPNGVPANVENVRCACETLVTTGTVIVAGEIRTQAYVDVQEIARGVIRRIGYNRAKFGFDCDTCGVMSLIHEQSPDIAQGRRRVV